MSVRLTVVSGLGPKEPAAFLLETEGLRLLLDLGQGPTPDMRPDPAEIGRVDALVLSHAHKDHCGALDLLGEIGDPPVYATRSVLDRIGPVKEARELPAEGRAEVLGIPVQTGRSGHALGAIWIRFDVDGGLLYMGDSCSESELFAFDEPPRSRALILDASYGTDEESRAAQARDIRALATPGHVHFPVPADGRGLEMAAYLHSSGIAVAIDDALRATLRRLSGPDRAFGKPAAVATAAVLAEAAAPAELDFPAPFSRPTRSATAARPPSSLPRVARPARPWSSSRGIWTRERRGTGSLRKAAQAFAAGTCIPLWLRMPRSHDPSEPKSSSPPLAERSTGPPGARHFPQPNSFGKSISDPS